MRYTEGRESSGMSPGEALQERGGLQGMVRRMTGCCEQKHTCVLTHRYHVQVSVGGVAARQYRLVGLMLAHVWGIVYGHGLHCEFHQPDVPCGHDCRIPGNLSAPLQPVDTADGWDCYKLWLLQCALVCFECLAMCIWGQHLRCSATALSVLTIRDTHMTDKLTRTS